MKQVFSNEQINKVIEESRSEDMQYIFIYRLWFKIYWIVYPLSKFLAKHNVRPNLITLLMLPSAYIASALFWSQNLFLIFFGALIIQFFQIFDFCDGKIARATKQTSIYGRELDYLMHVLCHPVVLISFYPIVCMTNNISNTIALIIILIGCVIEATNRSLHNLFDALSQKEDSQNASRENNKKNAILMSLYDNFYRGFISFPYFMSIAPFIGLIEVVLDIHYPIFFYSICLQIVFNMLNLLKECRAAYKICYF